MLPVIVLAVLVVVVAAISWQGHRRRVRMSCCDPGPWPPDDITARHAADDGNVRVGARPPSK